MTTDTKAVARYPKVDHCQLDVDGNYYCRHVEAMTSEGLHAKSDIAGQLGWRDREIDTLRTTLAAKSAEIEGLLGALQVAELALRERGLRACAEYKEIESALAKAMEKSNEHQDQ